MTIISLFRYGSHLHKRSCVLFCYLGHGVHNCMVQFLFGVPYGILIESYLGPSWSPILGQNLFICVPYYTRGTVRLFILIKFIISRCSICLGSHVESLLVSNWGPIQLLFSPVLFWGYNSLLVSYLGSLSLGSYFGSHNVLVGSNSVFLWYSS